MFQPIFDKQSELMNTYAGIEAQIMGGLNHHTRIRRPTEGADVHNQEHLRLLMWRTVEELNEAHQEELGSQEFKVELIDALHFLTEACVFSCLNWKTTMEEGNFNFEEVVAATKDLPVSKDRWKIQFNSNIRMMADATYLLKSKPWKQSPKPTDFVQFRKFLAMAYIDLIWTLLCYMSPEEILETYLGKAAENKQRQQEGY